MKNPLRKLVDSALVGGSRLAPRRLMAHWMWLLRKHPELADRWGFHVRQNQFYEPLPDFRGINRKALKERRMPPGIDFAVAAQAALVSRLASERREELDQIARDGQFEFVNGYFGRLDAAVYYALVRDLKPRRCIEIGSGYSTRIAALAFARNEEEGIAANWCASNHSLIPSDPIQCALHLD